MKNIITSIVVLGIINFTTTCRPTRSPVIGKNADPEAVNLKNVQTFGWTSEVDKIPDDREFISPTRVFRYEATRKKFKEAIEFELNAHGYKIQDSGTAPGMLVSFMILKQADTLRRTGGVITVQGTSCYRPA